MIEKQPNNINQPIEYYTKGSYWENRQDSKSDYKVRLVEYILKKYKISLFSGLKAAEIGCGQGAFLFPLSEYLEKEEIQYQLLGYDVSPQAINLANVRNLSSSNDKVSFLVGSAADIPSNLDFIFCMDVLEHVEDPFQFLRELSSKSKYLILHLPIEHSIGHLIMQTPSQSYRTFQHIHFYSWETAKLLINESPFHLL